MNMSASRSFFHNPFQKLMKSNIRSNSAYGVIIVLALIAFEAFNYGTTSYALRDLLGDLTFAGFQWSTLMALAFCGLDFAGIARLITQNGKQEDKKESWYLFGAWLIAATFNAALTWWGVALAISNHTLQSSAMVNGAKLATVVPVVVAIMVWIIRVLIIGSLTTALERVNASKRSSTSHASSSTPAGFAHTTASRPVTAQSHTRPAYQNYSADSSKQIQLTRMDH